MPLTVVSGVGRGMGVFDGDGDRRRGRGSFGSKCGASNCNQWGLCGVVILCRQGGHTAVPKLLRDLFLFSAAGQINFNLISVSVSTCILI